jgi:hypothetical protein
MDPLSVPTDRPMRVKKKPVIVLAQRATGTYEMDTPDGPITVHPGDIVVKGPDGTSWPVKPDLFGMTYEPA